MPGSVLFPTDLTPESLDAVRSAAARNALHGKCVVLAYGDRLPTSISGLLLESPWRRFNACSSPAFRDAVKHLRRQLGDSVSGLKVVPFCGNGSQAFREFLKVHSVERIHVIEGYQYSRNRKTVDLLPFAIRCGLPVVQEPNRRPYAPDELSKYAIFS